MRDPIPRLSRVFLFLVLAVAVGAAPAFAQGGSTSTISGTVTDSTGAVVPGADVVVKHVATNTTYNAVSGADGSFTIPAVQTGTYSVTVTLMGFKTAVLNDVIANVAQVANVRAVLQLGELAETVVVSGATEIVQTQATSVAATLGTKQIASLPVVGRGAFELVGYMPGVATTTGSLRDGTVNGLPQSAVNITLDGMNIQDNYAKSWDGMFTRVSPRLDAVEEVTVSTAAQGADMGSQGAAQVRFVTRSGTNRFQGSAYFYYRRDWMNTNTWFNLNRNVDAVTGKPTDRPRVFQDQPGFRVGGPIWKDKAFFFVNYEWISSPGTRTDTRTIMSPLSEQGMFQYSKGTIDLLALAASKGQTARIDPTIAKLLADVRASTSQGTVTTTLDPLTQSFAWQQATDSTTKYPTVRLDYNLTSNHRLTASGTYNHLVSDPDTTNSRQPVYPGFPWRGKQDSERFSYQLSMRSTVTSTMVNEVRYGATGGATLFSPDMAVDMFTNSNGYLIDWDAFKGIANPAVSALPSSREGSTMVIEDTLNWLKGKHSFTIGGSATRGDVWAKNQRLVPTTILGIATGDPADSMFSTANFPGASSTDLTNARNLYAVLTGRVSSIIRDARVGEDGEQYNILGQSLQKGRMWQLGFFLQDGWRWKPNLTINAGLRYEVQLPFTSLRPRRRRRWAGWRWRRRPARRWGRGSQAARRG
ncbi:MAG: TonB-dependent receptor [Vicinamibacterales bacterium]